MTPLLPTFGLQRLFHYCSIVAIVSSYVPYQMERMWLEHVLVPQVNSTNIRFHLWIPPYIPKFFGINHHYGQSISATLIIDEEVPVYIRPLELQNTLQRTTKYLTNIQLHRLPLISDRDVVAMEEAKSLETLILSELPIRCEFLGRLSSDRLHGVYINYCKLDDRSLQSLRCSENIVELHLIQNQLTGDCVESIQRMPSLRRLCLQGNRVPGRDLARLESHPSLEQIDLSEESVESWEDWKGLQRLGRSTSVSIYGRRSNGDRVMVDFRGGSISVSIRDSGYSLQVQQKLSDLSELDIDLFQ